MATGGRQTIYKEDDRVDEYLLNQLSKWILYHRLGSLARDLGMSHAEFSRIATATNQPEDQIFRVRENYFHHFLIHLWFISSTSVWLRCKGPFTPSVGVNAAIMFAILFSLKTVEFLENGCKPILERLCCFQ